MSISDWTHDERERRAAEQNAWEDAYLAECAAGAPPGPAPCAEYEAEDDALQGETSSRYEEGKMP